MYHVHMIVVTTRLCYRLHTVFATHGKLDSENASNDGKSSEGQCRSCNKLMTPILFFWEVLNHLLL